MRLAPFVWKDDRSTAEQLRVLLAKHIPAPHAAGAGDPRRALEEGGRRKEEKKTGSDSSFHLPPYSIERPDLRGFEWCYFQHLLEHSAAVFSGHDVSVEDGAFASNGQLVTLDQNGQVRRWDLGFQVEDQASRRDLPGGPSAQVRVLSPNGR